jgi:phytoene dehydrogenase-like protein
VEAQVATAFDAVIVGGGHNGLTCGAYLARAGLSVLVLERKGEVGGAAVTEEFVPGFRASTYSFIMGHLHPRVVADLELERHGLRHVVVDNVISPDGHGDCIVFSKDPNVTLAQIARYSQKDAANYPKFFANLSSTVDLLRRLQLETPVDPTRRDPASLLAMARFGWRYRHVTDEIVTLVEALSMSAYDYVARWFETPVVQAKLMYWATIGGTVGPYAPGTAFYLVAHLIGQGGMAFPMGGMGAITRALAASGAEKGMVIRTGADVREIRMKNGRATGVVLADGEEIAARMVISNLNAKTTFGGLVPGDALPDDFRERIARYRTRGKSFKLLCAVDRLPNYAAFDQARTNVEYPAYAHIGPTPEYLERAFDDAKYGWYSQRPFLSPIVPSFYDPSLAPEGRHVVSLYGGVTPHTLTGGDWDQERDTLVDRVFAVMDEHAPGFSSSVLGHRLLLPADIEADIGMPGGNTLHGEMTLDQLFFMRPAPGYSDYRSPVHALYQCGASTHPGGAVSGVPGHNAAREVLRDVRRRRV